MLGVFPQDEYGLFDAPVETGINFLGGTTQQIVGVDPSRVVLLISPAPNQVLRLALSTTPPQGGSITIGGATPVPLLLNHQQHGPAVQAAWFVLSTSGAGVIYAVSWSLRRNPGMYGYKGLFQTATPTDTHAVYNLRPSKPKSTLWPSNKQIVGFLRKRRPDLFGEE